jgi:hypothetical protein
MLILFRYNQGLPIRKACLAATHFEIYEGRGGDDNARPTGDNHMCLCPAGFARIGALVRFEKAKQSGSLIPRSGLA